ncbi:flavin-containing monooxygenase [Nocardia arthritidis]|uniref:NAD(P)-binding protein n=1 Tax=Nocardia arthritidis TaxID=228602 RepID=A0A6G9YRL1_9NOCA|nr:NAD(P)/FAD-dependent oxidoreductase [Nocardia arthritidis]QIS15533.1 NAD(P)-binding protein [Nocardia arthritidis]
MSAPRDVGPSVLIVGAGFGGLAMAAELARHGLRNFVVLEKSAAAGGVWCDNTYPGAGCDIPSPYYSYSFAPNTEWPRRFSLQPDIQRYIDGVIDAYDLRPHLRFGIEVTAAAFDAETATWHIETDSGESFEADVFVPATGVLSRPVLPGIQGRESFEGKAFHSARWDHDYDLTGKRVAVIGTGASAVQFIPRIQPQVARLTVFQRSAPHIIPKPDTEYGRLHQRAFRVLPLLLSVERAGFWGVGELMTAAILGNRPIAAALQWLSEYHLRRQVPDPALRATLTPDHPIGCKRILFANNYYPALAQPNVEVTTERISEITPRGVRTVDGVHHEVDAIIYGTGFAAQEPLAPMRIRGLDALDLHERWSGGARAYHGIAVPGFPNMFLVYGPNTSLGAGSIVFMHERQARYIRQLIEHLAAHRDSALEVRADVERRYDDEIQRRLQHTAWTGCASWYRNANGRVTANWPGTVTEYHRRTRKVDFADFHHVPAGPAALPESSAVVTEIR